MCTLKQYEVSSDEIDVIRSRIIGIYIRTKGIGWLCKLAKLDSLYNKLRIVNHVNVITNETNYVSQKQLHYQLQLF